VGWGLGSEKTQLALLRRGDWWGIGTMAIGLGSLIVFLEEGNRERLAQPRSSSLPWA